MGFLQWLFKKGRNTQEDDSQWAELEYSREGVNFHSEEDRSRYVTDLMEQIGEANKELSLLEGEYSQVTAYLTDMEEVEALPDNERDELKIAARKMINIDKEKQGYLEKKNRMSDKLFYQLKEKEDELEEGIHKIREAEKYGALVKQDLHRLDGERHAYAYRKSELHNMLANYKGMAVIFLTALVVCVLLLMVLQFGLKMDTRVGYFVAVVSAAIAITVLCVKYMDGEKELLRVERTINRLVQLQNKVKIRYINNTNLLDYLYVKFNVDSGKKLAAQYKQYQQEKEERKQFQELEAKRDYYLEKLQVLLKRYRVRYPDRLTSRPIVFVEKGEMVEMRHELIIRRQALRKQMDYNTQVVEKAKDEIMDIAHSFPQYAEEIAGMVDKYNRE
ncbi:MAG: hypothetical protein IJZ82_08935 [Lachnospiraceae bacterium]|nr:hypothetical protein [Lachnospiraceae bacterium]